MKVERRWECVMEVGDRERGGREEVKRESMRKVRERGR